MDVKDLKKLTQQETMDYQPSLDETNNAPYKVNINDKM